jgi:hypothetical protein
VLSKSQNENASRRWAGAKLEFVKEKCLEGSFAMPVITFSRFLSATIGKGRPSILVYKQHPYRLKTPVIERFPYSLCISKLLF